MKVAVPPGPDRPLLASKLAIPRMPGRVVARPRLFELLDRGVERPLTLVAAPAGSGKTILVASWISTLSTPGPVGWLSVDAGDNDPVQFWTYVLAALCRSGAVPADGRLQTLVPQAQDGEALPPLIVSGLDELASPMVLVLDDAHELTDARVLNGIEFLLRRAPAQLRLVLASRTDPPLPLHRLLLSGQLAQVRAADLAFTVAEVAELLAEYDYRSRLSNDDLARLQARTEGWAAGLRLAAVSMQHQPDPRRYVAELAGDDRSLAGYLVSEVLDRQPAERREFLMRTAVVDELSGELADALTGRDDGERTLARLEAANAFVMALGSRREWYRYHPLFAELLRCELRRQAPAAVPELHRRAADWYAGRGMPEAAVQQAAMGRDWDHAAELIVERGLDLVLHEQLDQFRGLLDRLPAAEVRGHPELALLRTAERIASGVDAAELSLPLARKLERLLDDDRRPRFSLLLAACRLLRARRAGDTDEAVAAGRAALQAQAELEGAADPTGVAEDALAVALSGLGAGELWTGELDAAEACLRAGQATATATGLHREQLDCLSHLALLAAIRGELERAIRTGTAAAELAAGLGDPPTTATAALLALAWAHYQRDDLAVAGRYLQRASEAGAAAGRPLVVAGRIVDAWLRQARGDLAGAFGVLGAARRDLSGWEPPRLLMGWLATTEAALHLAAGDTASARALLEGLGTDAPAGSRTIAVAHLLVAEGDPEEASRTVSPLAGDQTPARVPDLGLRIQAWLVHALAGDALGQADQAAASLARAVELAEPEEHRRVLLDSGTATRELVARYRDWLDASWPFLDELAQAALDPAPTGVSPMPALIEPLSQRERAVLRYLPTMLTFVEIGSELYISLNTTKSHVRSIYRKLGVDGRRDAVRRAASSSCCAPERITLFG